MKCVSVRLGNAIGQDIWELESICWGVGADKLLMMWGEGEDDTKGKHNPFTTATYHLLGEPEITIEYSIFLDKWQYSK